MAAGTSPVAEPCNPWERKSFASLFSDSSTSSSSPTTSVPIKTPTTFKGEPALIFTQEEIVTLSVPFKLSLIGKFSYGKPNMAELRKDFHTIGLKGDFKIGWLDTRHVLITLKLEEDFARLWIKGSWTIKGYPMRIFKWSPDFSPDQEPSIVPLWITLPHLPLHFFTRAILYSVASVVGIPLKIDAATASISRPHLAKICVEVDIMKPLPPRIWLGTEQSGFWQKIEVEEMPMYCLHCHRLGHSETNCRKLHSDKTIRQQNPKLKESKPQAIPETKRTTQQNPKVQNLQIWKLKDADLPSSAQQQKQDKDAETQAPNGSPNLTQAIGHTAPGDPTEEEAPQQHHAPAEESRQKDKACTFSADKQMAVREKVKEKEKDKGKGIEKAKGKDKEEKTSPQMDEGITSDGGKQEKEKEKEKEKDKDNEIPCGQENDNKEKEIEKDKEEKTEKGKANPPCGHEGNENQEKQKEIQKDKNSETGREVQVEPEVGMDDEDFSGESASPETTTPTVNTDESPIPEPSKHPEENPPQVPAPSVKGNPILPSSPQLTVQHDLSAGPPLVPPQPTHVPQQPLVEGSSSSMPAALSADSRQLRETTPSPTATNQDSTNPIQKDGHMDFAADVEGINLIVELSESREVHAASPSATKKKKEVSPSNVVTRQQSRRSSASTPSL